MARTVLNTEYEQEHIQAMLEIEDAYRTDPQYLRRHPNWERHNIANWMYVTCKSFDLVDETFLLALNIFDRYMATRENDNNEYAKEVLMLCVSIAWKHEEVASFSWENLTGGLSINIRQSDLMKRELEVMVATGWRLSIPSVRHYIAALSSVLGSDPLLDEAVNYVLLASVQHCSTLGIPLSELACGVYMFAKKRLLEGVGDFYFNVTREQCDHIVFWPENIDALTVLVGRAVDDSGMRALYQEYSKTNHLRAARFIHRD